MNYIPPRQLHPSEHHLPNGGPPGRRGRSTPPVTRAGILVQLLPSSAELLGLRERQVRAYGGEASDVLGERWGETSDVNFRNIPLYRKKTCMKSCAS